MAKRSTILPKAALCRILVKAGAKRVSADALAVFADVLEDIGLEISAKANRIAQHAGRKTIHEGDIKIATK